jgi:glucosamine--fructose-6-phosphate aminotransferase (isomerizing)
METYHAGFVSRYLFNKYAKISTHAEVSPEFSYLVSDVLHSNDYIIGISQSGESEMTLQAIKAAKEKKISTLAITNTENSTITKISDRYLYLRSGEEKSVLATKTYINTLGILRNIALEVGSLRNQIS